MAYIPELTKSDLYKMQKKKEENGKIERARLLYKQGMSLYEISNRVGLTERMLVTKLGLG